ncbi:MAG: glycogen debranching protein, partial [Chloroflexi bacterium]|nr:glycogen debranching protein [Chloroflexota bacterium]
VRPSVGARRLEPKGARRAPLRERLLALYPRLLAWHRYLATARDPDGLGLLTIYHPWESGTDNSPRWDVPLSNVVVGLVPPYTRRDLGHVTDPWQRPTHAEYDRYLWLLESLKAARYEDAAVHRDHPFLVKDILASAIFVLANHALARLAEWLGAPRDERDEIAAWADRFGRAVEGRWDATAGLAFDLDLRTGRRIVVSTLAGLAPLLVPGLRADLVAALARQLAGPSFASAPGLVYPVVPSTTPGSPGFHPRTYWRGPLWPFANWLLWWGLRQHDQQEAAATIRRANLALLAGSGARFSEYFEPFTGEPLGSLDQSWTAAVALDWLAAEG